MNRRLFVAQFVVAEENQWFAPGTDGPPIRAERLHHIETHLFAAADADAAYQLVCEWLPGFSDANHDGPGDLTRIYAVGLHQIEELLIDPGDIPTILRQLYGMDVGRYDPRAVDLAGVPLVRGKSELALFHHLQR